jgi:MoaA/NifB/PqqE/SkfB family radical SAM enzyme
MCPQTSGREKDFLKKMSLDEFERVVSEAAKHGLRVVNLEGSGEPTLNSDLPEYISVVKKYGAQAVIFSNGYRMHGQFMKDCVDAGLDYFRFSVIGYNREEYKKWMSIDAFGQIVEQAVSMQEYIRQVGSNCVVGSYHLVNNAENKDYEVEQYQENFIDKVGSSAEIWMMHNWSGMYQSVTFKRKGNKRTCGRPFSPDLTVRAGGNDGHRLSVAPCCQTLGRDSEAVLGNLDTESIEDVWNGERYKWLRNMHKEQRFDEVSFCKNCDFLYEDPSVLVWTNCNRSIDKMIGTNFTLQEYK